MKDNLISQAIDLVGLCKLARLCGVRHQSVYGWVKASRLPRSDWTGENEYASCIEIATGGRITRAQLLDLKPTAASAVAKPLKNMDNSHA